jgi:hypothetical protein
MVQNLHLLYLNPVRGLYTMKLSLFLTSVLIAVGLSNNVFAYTCIDSKHRSYFIINENGGMVPDPNDGNAPLAFESVSSCNNYIHSFLKRSVGVQENSAVQAPQDFTRNN